MPSNRDNYQIWQLATAEQLSEAEQIRKYVTEFKKKDMLPSKLWTNHFKSVRDFRLHLFRNGGKYTSLMEWIRKVRGERTIGSLPRD